MEAKYGYLRDKIHSDLPSNASEFGDEERIETITELKPMNDTLKPPPPMNGNHQYAKSMDEKLCDLIFENQKNLNVMLKGYYGGEDQSNAIDDNARLKPL